MLPDAAKDLINRPGVLIAAATLSGLDDTILETEEIMTTHDEEAT